MSSNCEAILREIRTGLSDRTSPAIAEGGSIGPVSIPRVDHAGACVSIRPGFSRSLGS